jgi:hypothetical protein
MDYSRNYYNMLNISERMKKEIEKVKTPRGLGSRSELRDFGVEDFNAIRAKYVDLVRQLFTPSEEQMGVQEEGWSPDIEYPTADQSEEIVGGKVHIGSAPEKVAAGYPEGLTQAQIEAIIQQEASLRNIEPSVAVAIFRAEGASNYQSQVARSGKGSLGGKEASFGPYQLYTGGGLGNAYEKATGRVLTQDNTVEGITTQIRFALDEAAKGGWTPWYGRGPAGVGERQGLSAAKPIYNWKK